MYIPDAPAATAHSAISSVDIWSAGYFPGYGYCLPPYGTAYRSALRTTRTRTTTRTLRLSFPGFLGAIFCTASFSWCRL